MRHPLEKVHTGRTRTGMISRYVGGYHWLGLYDSRLRIVWRPTDITPDGHVVTATQMSIYQCP